MAKNLQELSLLDIAPGSIKTDKAVNAAIKAIDPELKSVSQSISEAFIISRIDELPEILIDLLAWQWHVDYYEPDLSLDVKRSLVKSSIKWHRIKGTPYAVEQLVSQIFGNAKVSEWFDYAGRAYFFRVAVNVGGLNTLDMGSEALKKLRRVINCAKNARSWLEFIALVYDLEDTQLTREDLNTLRILTGWEDIFPYRTKTRRPCDYDKFDGSFEFSGDMAAVFGGEFGGDFSGLNVFDGLCNFANLDGLGTERIFDGSFDFGDLSFAKSFGSWRDVIDADDLALIMRLNALKDDYSRELIELRFDGLNIFDGRESFANLNFLPRDAKFEIALNAVITDTERIFESNKLSLKILLEDFYFSHDLNFESLNGRYKFVGGLDLSGAFNLDGLKEFNFENSELDFKANESRGLDELIIAAKSFMRDDYSSYEVKAEFAGAASLDGALSLDNSVKDCYFKLDGAASLDGGKFYLVMPQDKSFGFSAKLDVQDTEQIIDADLNSSVKYAAAFDGLAMLDGYGDLNAFGVLSFEDLNNLELARFDFDGCESLDGISSFKHDGRPEISAA